MHHEALTAQGKQLFPLLPKFGEFYLAGGTALALQVGHRVSVDFDLFSGGPIEKDLFAKAKRVFDNLSIETLINNPEELSVFVEGVKITFLQYPFPLQEALVSLEGLSALSVREIAATKAYTIGRRGTYKDYVDLYVIISGQHASLKDIIDMADKKYGPEFNSRLFLEQLIFMDDIEDFEISFLKDPVTKDQILLFFTEQIRAFSI